MNRGLRLAATAVGAIALLAAAAVAFGSWNADRRRERHVALPPLPTFALQESPALLERGRYLFSTRGCAECHGADGGGRAFIDSGAMRVKSPDISGGPTSAVAHYTADDWSRTLRHGVKPDGTPVFIMPAEDFARLTDTDLSALVTYVKQLPPAGGSPLETKLPLHVRVLYGLGIIPDAPEKIDHALPPAQPVPEALSVEHGRYVASMCMGCHGAGLSGGKIPGGPPDWPAAANLTPGEGSVIGRYPDAGAFMTMLRSGRRPDGSAIAVMPFASLKGLSDIDAGAVYLFLKSLPPRPAGSR